jgi:hypothetical protein
MPSNFRLLGDNSLRTANQEARLILIPYNNSLVIMTIQIIA